MKNTQTVKKALSDFSKGDIASMVEALDEKVVWINPDAPEVTFSLSVNGKNNVPSFFRKMGETINVTRFEMDNFAEQDSNVISWGSYDATVRSTGKKFTTPLILIWKFNPEGKVVHWQAHTNTLAQSKAF